MKRALATALLTMAVINLVNFSHAVFGRFPVPYQLGLIILILACAVSGVYWWRKG